MARPTFRIEELRIRNFRGIDELDLKFQASREDEPGGLVVIAGDNGCGKTSVLEAILLVLGKQQMLPADAAPLEEQVRFGAEDFQIDAALRLQAAATQVKARASAEILRHSDPLMTDETGALHRWVTLPVAEDLPRVEYYSARREPEAPTEAQAFQDGHVPRSEREARRVADLKRRIVNTYYRSLQAGKGGPMPEGSPFVRLQRFMQRFMGEAYALDVLPTRDDPGADFDVVVRKGETPIDVTSLAMARSAAVSRKDIPTIIPIDRLSSGEVALFTFAGPLIFRDAPADVVLIDEPEQHLHVQWQGALMRALMELSPESQFIVATHSLDILDLTLPHERHILLRSDDPRALDAAQ